MASLYKMLFILSLTAGGHPGLEELDIIQIWGNKIERLQKKKKKDNLIAMPSRTA